MTIIPKGFVLVENEEKKPLPKGFILVDEPSEETTVAPEQQPQDFASGVDLGGLEPFREPLQQIQESQEGPTIMENLGAASKSLASGAVQNLLAAQQGVSPVVSTIGGEMNFERAPQEAQDIFNELGRVQNEQTQVVLIDPATQQPTVFLRNPEMEEGRALRAARVLSGGVMAPAIAPTRAVGPAAQAARDLQTIGVEPSVVTTSQNPNIQRLANAFKDVIGTSAPLQEAGGGVVSGLARTADEIAAGLGPARSLEDAGVALAQGAQNFVTRFDEASGQLLQRVNDLIPAETSVNLSNTLEKLSSRGDVFVDLPNIAKAQMPPQFAGFIDDVVRNSGQMTWQQARAFRSWVGQMQRDNSVFPDIAKSDWRKLYGTLSEDLKAAASAQGPEALSAFSRHNQFFKAGASRTESALDKLLKDVGEGSLFNQVISATRGTSTANLGKLRAIRRSLKPEEWDNVAAVAFRKLGSAKGLQGDDIVEFSPSVFLNQWKTMTPQAREILFGGDRYAKLQPQLNALVRTSERFRQFQELANPPKTAGTLANLGLAGLLTIEPTAAAGTIIGGNIAARLLSSPKFLNTLNSIANSRGTSAANLAKLDAFARQNPEMADAVGEFIVAAQQYYGVQ